jgi:hypothetical protein
MALCVILPCQDGEDFPVFLNALQGRFAGEHDGLGRSRRPTLAKMWQTWVWPVCPAMTMVSLVSALEGPRAISRSASVSLFASAPGGAGGGAKPAMGCRAPAGQQRSSGRDHLNRADQLGGGRNLEHEVLAPSAQHLMHVILAMEAGQRQCPRLTPGRLPVATVPGPAAKARARAARQ